MSDRSPNEVTSLLREWSAGEKGALERLMPLVYDELQRLARSYLSHEREGHTLQPTALVHEAYLRLVDQTRVNWQSRGHFFGVAAQMMRRILVDHARARLTGKRGRGVRALTLDDALTVSPETDEALVRLDDALSALKEFDPKQCRLVELRYFAGLTLEETAEALSVSTATVKREWTVAKAWLRHEMSPGEGAKP
jgi:RNA polymerase sigma factor (TIGR02999 family)